MQNRPDRAQIISRSYIVVSVFQTSLVIVFLLNGQCHLARSSHVELSCRYYHVSFSMDVLGLGSLMQCKQSQLQLHSSRPASRLRIPGSCPS